MRLLSAVLIAACLCSPVADAQKRRASRSPSSATTWVVHAIRTSYITHIAEGPDGFIWFTGASVGVVSRDGSVEMLTNDPCGPVFVGVDRTVWCSTTPPGLIVEVIRRIGPDRSWRDFPVRAGAAISDLLGTPDGNIVFTESAKDRLGRLTADGQVEELALPPSLDRPSALTIGADGAVFFATRRAVARWIADGTYQQFRADMVFAGRSAQTGFTSMAATDDGSLWLGVPAELRTSGKMRGGAIVRLTADGSFAEVVTLPLLVSPAFVTAGNDGSIWFVTRSDFFQNPQALVRRLPDGNLERYELPALGGFSIVSATGIVIDASGAPTVAVNDTGQGSVLLRLQLDEMK